METTTLEKIQFIEDFGVRIEDLVSKYDEVIIFWDLNETLLNPKVGLNLKIEKTYKMLTDMASKFRRSTQSQIFGIMKHKYYHSDLGIRQSNPRIC